MSRIHRARFVVPVFLAGVIGSLPLTMVGCNKEESSSKTTTTKRTETPDGVKKTTETTEKKVETEKK